MHSVGSRRLDFQRCREADRAPAEAQNKSISGMETAFLSTQSLAREIVANSTTAVLSAAAFFLSRTPLQRFCQLRHFFCRELHYSGFVSCGIFFVANSTTAVSSATAFLVNFKLASSFCLQQQ